MPVEFPFRRTAWSTLLLSLVSSASRVSSSERCRDTSDHLRAVAPRVESRKTSSRSNSTLLLLLALLRLLYRNCPTTGGLATGGGELPVHFVKEPLAPSSCRGATAMACNQRHLLSPSTRCLKPMAFLQHGRQTRRSPNGIGEKQRGGRDGKSRRIEMKMPVDQLVEHLIVLARRRCRARIDRRRAGAARCERQGTRGEAARSAPKESRQVLPPPPSHRLGIEPELFALEHVATGIAASRATAARVIA